MNDLNQAIKETEEILLSKGRIHASLHLNRKYKLSLAEANKITEELSDKLRKEGKHIAHLPAQAVKFPFTVFGSIFLLFGLPMLFGAIYIFTSNQEDFAKRVKVEGEVVSLDGFESVTPIVEYEWQGNIYEIRGSVASNPPAFELGEKAEVLVDPDNPADAIINSFIERWLLVLILGIMGTIFSTIGLGTVFHKQVGKLI